MSRRNRESRPPETAASRVRGHRGQLILAGLLLAAWLLFLAAMAATA